MGVLLNRNCDSPLGFNISCTSLAVNQSLKDSELVQPYSESTQTDDSFPGPAVSLLLPIIYTIICASGVLANGLVISVVLDCKQKVVSDIYILNLATADLLFLLGMPLIIHQLLQEYVAVVYSSPIAQRRTLHCTAMINVGIWIGSFILAIPAMLYTRIFWDNKTEICLIDLAGPSSLYWYILYQSLIAFLLPLLVITVLYSLTLQHLFRAMRHVHWKASARSQKVTRMVLTIIAAFFICWIPYHVLQLVNLTATPSATFFYLYQATICLSYAHSCVSPILVIFCTKFFQEKMAQSRYCKCLTIQEHLSFTAEITATVYSPQGSQSVSPCSHHHFGIEIPLSSMSETSSCSMAVSGHGECNVS